MRLLMLLVLLFPVLSFGSEWLEEVQVSAEQGEDNAQYLLGLFYNEGDGVPEDHKEAVKWFRLAADQGLANAQYMLGLGYALGIGLPKDNLLAYMWYNIAGANGANGDKVEKNMGILTGKMSQDEIAKAQEMTRQYIKDHPDVY